MSEDCAICGGASCWVTPIMVERYAAGLEVEHWRRVHDGMNSIFPPPTPEDLALRAFAAEGGGCCGGGPDHTSTEEMT